MNLLATYVVPHPPLIVPAIGKGQEQAISETIAAYKKVAEEIKELNPETIVLVSPHSIMYADYFHISPGDGAEGDFSQFRAPEVSIHVNYDEQFSNHLTTMAEKNEIRAGFLGERDASLDHGIMVPLYFLKEAYGGKIENKIVRIGLSGQSFEEHYKLGQLIQKTAEDLNKNIVFIASGDMSHRLTEDGPYGYQKEGPVYDKKIMEMLENADFTGILTMHEDFCELAGECGHRSLCMMAGVLDGMDVKPHILSYEGPFGVGYGIVTFHPIGFQNDRKLLEKVRSIRKKQANMRKEKEDAYVSLARRSLETYILEGRKITVDAEVPEEMRDQRAGAFVSLKKDGHLRGCIGTIEAVHPSLAEEIIENAINASTMDPRFDPVTKDELDSLVISVDVLGETEEISSMDELDVKRYGVIVTCGYKRGLLLPNLDGINTVEEQVRIAMEKGGIEEGEPISLSRFEVIRHF